MVAKCIVLMVLLKLGTAAPEPDQIVDISISGGCEGCPKPCDTKTNVEGDPQTCSNMPVYKDSCFDWAQYGECANNTSFMLVECPCACQGCYDKNIDCKFWAENDNCRSHPEYMINVCPASCTNCLPPAPDTKSISNKKEVHPKPASPPSPNTSDN